MPKAKSGAVATAPSLSTVAEDAVRVMGAAILDADTPNDRKVELDAASKALWSAVRWTQQYSAIVQAVPKKATSSLDLIDATCAKCGDRALLLPSPPPDTTGFAICRTCSFLRRRRR